MSSVTVAACYYTSRGQISCINRSVKDLIARYCTVGQLRCCDCTGADGWIRIDSRKIATCATARRYTTDRDIGSCCDATILVDRKGTNLCCVAV